jgi:hypothetical protein
MTLNRLFAIVRRSARFFQSASRKAGLVSILGATLTATASAQTVSPVRVSQPAPSSKANGPLYKSFMAMEARQARTRAAKLALSGTPYSRTFGPLMKQWAAARSQAGTASPRTTAKSQAQNTPASDGVSMPGYVAAPFIAAAPLSDANRIFASVNGDFNKDGKQDIATINTDGTLNVILNGGSGDFTQNHISYTDVSAVSSYPLIAYGVAADLNGDGYADVVGMDVNNGALVVWINNGSGGFAPAVSVPVAPSNGGRFFDGGAIAVGDVNGDGNFDVVAVSQVQNYDPGSGDYTTNVATQVFAGDGKGNLATPTEVDSFLGDDYYTSSGQGLQLADMNGDGKLDIVLQMQGEGNDLENFVTVALNQGGTFAPFSLTNRSGVQTSSSVTSDLVVADVNGDGHPDVLFASGSDAGQYASDVAVAFGDGTGNLSAQSQTAASNVPYLATFAVADVNGDGKLDIVTFNSGSVSVFTGNGSGTFSATPLTSYAAGDGTGNQQPGIADYNNDGKADIVYVDSGLEVASFYAGNGDGTFRGAPVVTPGGVNPAFILVLGAGDINGDGIPDLLAYDTSTLYGGQTTTPKVVSLISDGKGHFKEVTALSAATIDTLSPTAAGDSFSFEVFPTVVDLNGDARADIVFSNGTGVYTALANADGSFQAPALVPGLALSCFPTLGDAGNVDGTGHTSLVLAYGGDSLCGGGGPIPSSALVLINDGHANFTASVFPVGAALYQARLVDLNGDGYPDLVASDVSSYTNNVYAAPNLGAAAAAAGSIFDPNRVTTILPNYAVADILPGDYNGDGKQDLALATEGQIDVAGNNSPIEGTEGVLLLPNQGNFTFGQSNLVAQGTSASWAEWSDINQDGIPDLVLTAAASEQFDTTPSFGLSVLPGLGAGIFGPPSNQVLPISNVYVFTGDFNQDGAPDAVVSGDYTGSLFLNRGGDSLALTVSPTSVAQGNNVTFTATLKTTLTDFTPGGTVTFTSNGATLGVAPLSNGVATLSYNVATGAPAGTDTVVASYTGDSHFNQASASVTYAVTALTPAFTVSLSAPSITLTGSQTGVATVTLTANGSFQGTITLSTSVSGSGLNVLLNPTTVTLAADQSQDVSLLIGTGSILSAESKHTIEWKGAGLTFAMASLLPFFLSRFRGKRLSLAASMLLCVFLLPVAALIGCGGSSSPSSAKGTRTVTITATPSVAGAAAQTTTLTVTLQ